MREQAMEPDRHADACQQVEDGEQREIDAVDPSVPQQHDREQDAREGHHHAGEVGVPLGP